MYNELYHYGVIGMKWGVHKAREYHQDRTAYAMRQKNKEARHLYKIGDIDKATYKAIKKQNKQDKYLDDSDFFEETRKVKIDRDKKASDIFRDELNTAKSEIPYYIEKRAAIKFSKIALTAAYASLPVQHFMAGKEFIRMAEVKDFLAAGNLSYANKVVSLGGNSKDMFYHLGKAAKMHVQGNKYRKLAKASYDAGKAATALGAGIALGPKAVRASYSKRQRKNARINRRNGY